MSDHQHGYGDIRKQLENIYRDLTTLPRVPRCMECKTEEHVRRSHRFDSYYCQRCVMWMEPACVNPSCVECPIRPSRPILGTV